MMNPSYPAGGDGGGSPPYGPTRVRRLYLGSQQLTSSGTWSKATALALPFLTSIPEAALEVDLECIGAGGSGIATSTDYPGGSPGLIAARTVSMADLLASESYVIGAGLAASDGGSTSFGQHLSARGGLYGGAEGRTDGYPQIRHALFSDRPVGLHSPGFADGPRGPGAGGIRRGNIPGGASNSAVSEHRLAPGAFGADNGNGRDATTAWQYGSGGTNSGAGGRGGIPGGGGASCDFGDTPGPGGRGEIRLHFYVWESVQ